MINGGEFNNIIGNSKNNLEFEKYCKSEGLSSLHIKSEMNKFYNSTRAIYLKKLLKSVIDSIKYNIKLR